MKIILPGKPIPKARPRFRGKFAYDSQKPEKYYIQMQMHQFVETIANGLDLPYNQRLHIDLTFHTLIPKNPSERKRMAFIGQFPETKPDLDNLIKFYLDCGNHILWRDDKLIVDLHAKKIYSLEPRTEIEFWPITNLLPKSTESVERDYI